MARERVAVIGSGVSGLTAAYLLQRNYDVVLFESAPRLGGHAHTHDVTAASGGTVAVDSGFMVHNDRTYPNLLRLFDELDIRTQDSDMSMSVRCLGCGLEYAGGKGVHGLLPQPRTLARARYLRMLTEFGRFRRDARRLLNTPGDSVTLGTFLDEGGYTRYFAEHLVLPLVSAVWSAGERISRDYPAQYLFEFLSNHGMLAIGGSPQWRTIVGGSRTYVDRAVKNLTAVRSATPVRSVTRHPDGVDVRDDGDQQHPVEHVVLATHADDALGLLTDASAAENRVLGAFDYSRNTAWLHTDAAMLPRTIGASASWNYLKASCAGRDDRVAISYHMNRLMRLSEPSEYVVTLNDTARVDPARVIATMHYDHPLYTPESVAAQPHLAALNTGRTAFAGAYHGWGFHEDGCLAGVRAAASFGVHW